MPGARVGGPVVEGRGPGRGISRMGVRGGGGGLCPISGGREGGHLASTGTSVLPSTSARWGPNRHGPAAPRPAGWDTVVVDVGVVSRGVRRDPHPPPPFQVPSVWGFPSGSDGKASACSAGDPGSIPGLGRSPGEGNGNPLTPVLLPGKFHGWSLVRYSPWGNKESDTTERLHFTADKKLGLSQRGGFAPGWISPGGSSEACSPLLKVGVWAEHTWLTLGAENS